MLPSGVENFAYWQERDFTAVSGKDLQHKDLWTVVVSLLQKICVKWVKVPSHTTIRDYNHDGNREVDALAQGLKCNALKILLPSEWKVNGRIIPPDSEHYEILKEVHAAYGHIGEARMRFYLDGLQIDIPRWLPMFRKIKRLCPECAQVGGQRKVRVEPATIICDVPRREFSMDIAGPFPTKTVLGNQFFLIICDNGQAEVMVFPLRSVTGRIVTNCLARWRINHLEGVSLRMDNGTHFANKHVRQFLEMQGIMAIWSVPWASHTNGVAERGVRKVKEWILKNAPRDWDTTDNLVELHILCSMPKLSN